jgi:hypothetical protein
VVTGPFTANKKYLADKWCEMARKQLQQGEQWDTGHYRQLDVLLERYRHYQLYAAMLDYFRQKKWAKGTAHWFDFYNWCRVDGNVPSERLAKVTCLIRHFPGDERLLDVKIKVQTYEDAWFPDGRMSTAMEQADEVIDNYMRKVV